MAWLFLIEVASMAEVLTLDDYSCSGSDDGGGSHFGSFYADAQCDDYAFGAYAPDATSTGAARLLEGVQKRDGAGVSAASASLAQLHPEDVLCSAAWPDVSQALAGALRGGEGALPLDARAAAAQLAAGLLKEALAGAASQAVELGSVLAEAVRSTEQGGGAQLGAQLGVLLGMACDALATQAIHAPSPAVERFCSCVVAVLVSHARPWLGASDARFSWLARWLQCRAVARAAAGALERFSVPRVAAAMIDSACTTRCPLSEADVLFAVGAMGAMLRARGSREAITRELDEAAVPTAVGRLTELCGRPGQVGAAAAEQAARVAHEACEQGARDLALSDVAVERLAAAIAGGNGAQAAAASAVLGAAFAAEAEVPPARAASALADPRHAARAVARAALSCAREGDGARRREALLAVLRAGIAAPHVACGLAVGAELANMAMALGESPSADTPMLDTLLALCASPTGALLVLARAGRPTARRLLDAAMVRLAADVAWAERPWGDVEMLVEAVGRLAALPGCGDCVAWDVLLAPMLCGESAEALSRRLAHVLAPGPGGEGIELWYADENEVDRGARGWDGGDARALAMLRALSPPPPGGAEPTAGCVLSAMLAHAAVGGFASERGPALSAGVCIALAAGRRGRTDCDGLRDAGHLSALAAAQRGPIDAASSAVDAVAAALGEARDTATRFSALVSAPPLHIASALSCVSCAHALATPKWQEADVQLREARDRSALAAAALAEELVAREFPATHGALAAMGAPVGALAKGWLDASFWGYAPWGEVVAYIEALRADGDVAAAVFAAAAAVSLGEDLVRAPREGEPCVPVVLSAAALPAGATAATVRLDCRCRLTKRFGQALRRALCDPAEDQLLKAVVAVCDL